MKKLLFILCLTPYLLFGQGYQVNLQGQAQQGMGGAGTGYMQDASSLFFNPGGSSFVNKNEIIVGMTPTFANTTFLENKTLQTAHTESPVGTPLAAYGLFQIKDSSRWKHGTMGRRLVRTICINSIKTSFNLYSANGKFQTHG